MSPAELIIAWHVSRASIPLPRSSTRAHIEANFAAASVQLPPEVVARIDALPTRVRLNGDPDTVNEFTFLAVDES